MSSPVYIKLLEVSMKKNMNVSIKIVAPFKSGGSGVAVMSKTSPKIERLANRCAPSRGGRTGLMRACVIEGYNAWREGNKIVARILPHPPTDPLFVILPSFCFLSFHMTFLIHSHQPGTGRYHNPMLLSISTFCSILSL